MNTQFKAKFMILLVFAGFAFSCKNNDNVPKDNYDNKVNDSISTTIDTVGPSQDSIKSDKNGTTGATGEGSTGSGSAGTTQKGNTSVKTDSTSSTNSTKGR